MKQRKIENGLIKPSPLICWYKDHELVIQFSK